MSINGSKLDPLLWFMSFFVEYCVVFVGCGGLLSKSGWKKLWCSWATETAKWTNCTRDLCQCSGSIGRWNSWFLNNKKTLTKKWIESARFKYPGRFCFHSVCCSLSLPVLMFGEKKTGKTNMFLLLFVFRSWKGRKGLTILQSCPSYLVLSLTMLSKVKKGNFVIKMIIEKFNSKVIRRIKKGPSCFSFKKSILSPHFLKLLNTMLVSRCIKID